MPKLIIDKENCKGCSMCVNVCPKKILELAQDEINPKGYHPLKITDEAACIGCAFCATMCPDMIITIEK